MLDEIVIRSWIFHGLKTRRSQRILCLLNLFAQLQSRNPTHMRTCISYIINALLVLRRRWGLDGRRVEGGMSSAQQQQTQLKSSLGYFPASLGWTRKNWGQASSCLKMGTGKHPKPKYVFEGDVSPIWDQGRFPAAFWPDPPDDWHVVHICPFVTAPGDKQQQAGLKGDFLRSAAKLSLAAASQLPARSDL